MKTSKTMLGVLLSISLSTAASAGSFQSYGLNGFTLHVYRSGDVMDDTSYIVESSDALVTLEEPLFKVNDAEFDTYAERLGKKVAARITDYHLGGTGSFSLTMPEGMPAFISGPVYGGMMQGFQRSFGETMVALPSGTTQEVPFESVQQLAGVDYAFEHGAASDFPAASILIGSQVYLTHWAPAIAHASALQISSREAVTAEIAEARESLDSGAVLFAGSHGGVAGRRAVQFKISYLETVERLLDLYDTPAAFRAALLEAYPGLPGAGGVDALAAALYK
ncbi:MAG TPA: hypothetical protein IAB18_08745 [Candidatus Avisuccinivibrio pullicola]|nr:hypothetical protein [Candidatus Avisuccinivibrio pullicola]